VAWAVLPGAGAVYQRPAAERGARVRVLAAQHRPADPGPPGRAAAPLIPLLPCRFMRYRRVAYNVGCCRFARGLSWRYSGRLAVRAEIGFILHHSRYTSDC
jgi:hypothetical protein